MICVALAHLCESPGMMISCSAVTTCEVLLLETNVEKRAFQHPPDMVVNRMDAKTNAENSAARLARSRHAFCCSLTKSGQ
jgi:hypothetical protein